MSRCVHPRGDFNSRPSARGDSPRKAGETFRLDFNSRPSARGDHDAHRRGLVGTISIHAPPRGATRRIGKNRSRVLFQFTPIREGRPPPEQMEASPAAFQFTPLREGRHVRLWERTICTGISIHAPPRGATTQVDTIDGYVLFQFTPLREGRLVPFPRIKSFILFQFTPLREGRPRLSSVLVASRYISIHAPPRGATSRFVVLDCYLCISIHAPPRGATL